MEAAIFYKKVIDETYNISILFLCIFLRTSRKQHSKACSSDVYYENVCFLRRPISCLLQADELHIQADLLQIEADKLQT